MALSFLARHDPALDALVHPKERSWFALMLVTSLAAYAWLGLSIVRGAADATAAAGAMVILMYAFLGVAVMFLMHGLMIGHLRGNGVRVGARQFPHLHRMVELHARRIGMASVPDVFVLQSGGVLNAFATRFFGRDFVVIYSDVLALAEERGEAAVGFIVAHELAHVARGHLRFRWLTMPARMIPYLAQAYSRACEFTCDRFGAHCQPNGAVDGLLVLAAGPSLYRHVDARTYALQAQTETGFWVSWSQRLASHPHLTTRVGTLLGAGVGVPEYTPMRFDSAVSTGFGSG